MLRRHAGGQLAFAQHCLKIWGLHISPTASSTPQRTALTSHLLSSSPLGNRCALGLVTSLPARASLGVTLSRGHVVLRMHTPTKKLVFDRHGEKQSPLGASHLDITFNLPTQRLQTSQNKENLGREQKFRVVFPGTCFSSTEATSQTRQVFLAV